MKFISLTVVGFALAIGTASAADEKLKLSRNRDIDFRVNTCPTLYGEKVVLRILDSSAATLGVEAPLGRLAAGSRALGIGWSLGSAPRAAVRSARPRSAPGTWPGNRP